MKFNILLPAIIEKNDINKYNSSHEYYNDICYTYTTDNGTDIILTDRKNEFISYNMSLCESKCEYGGYYSGIKKAKCECEVKIKIPLMSEITIDPNLLKKKLDIRNSLNIKLMKCYKTAFSKKGLLHNIGSYIILICILIVTVCLIIFLIKGFSRLKEYINAINSCKNTNFKNDNIITENPEKNSEREGEGKRKNQNKIKKPQNIGINFEYNSNEIINNNSNEVKANDENNRSKQNIIKSPPKKIQTVIK